MVKLKKRRNMEKRGLSAVVTTLLIILLVLVAVGIIWVVVRNVVTQGATQISVTSKCLQVQLEAVGVNETAPGVYSVTLKRDAGGANDLGGVMVNVFNSTTSSGVINFGALNQLDTKTVSLDTSVNATKVINGNKIEFTPFFLDSSGAQQLCSQTTTYSF